MGHRGDNLSWDGGWRGWGKEAGLDKNRWNHCVLNQCFMSGYRDKVTREVGGANRGGLAPYFASVKQTPHFP